MSTSLPLVLLSLSSAAYALNIVAQGPNLKKKAAIGASTVSMPKDHLKKIFQMLDTDGAFPHWVLFRQT